MRSTHLHRPFPKRSTEPLRDTTAHHPHPWRHAAPGAPPLAGWVVGQPQGEPWLVLHGGPGSVAQGGLLAPFDASIHWAWALQQRGNGVLTGNRSGRWHVDALLTDMETLRRQLGLLRWSVLGGSWGALVALAYVQKHPEAVSRVVLRGPFQGRSADVWRLLHTVRQVWRARANPKAHSRLPPLPRQRLQLPVWLAQTHRVLRNATAAPCHDHLVWAWLLAEAGLAARGARRAWLHATPANAAALRQTWSQMLRQSRRRSAQQRMGRRPDRSHTQKVNLQVRVLSRRCCRALQGGWSLWRRWLASQPVGQRLTVLQGRFDAVCAPANALHLRGLDPMAEPSAVSLQWVDSGHLSDEPAMRRALAKAMKHRDE